MCTQDFCGQKVGNLSQHWPAGDHLLSKNVCTSGCGSCLRGNKNYQVFRKCALRFCTWGAAARRRKSVFSTSIATILGAKNIKTELSRTILKTLCWVIGGGTSKKWKHFPKCKSSHIPEEIHKSAKVWVSLCLAKCLTQQEMACCLPTFDSTECCQPAMKKPWW